MEQITEDYVSFETAKLLKEKGFEPPHDYRKCMPIMYTNNGEIKWGIWSDDWYPRITLQMAMKWLREVHNVVIVVDYIYECTDKSYCYKIYKLGENGKPERVPIEGVRYDTLGEPHVETVGHRDYSLSFFSYKTYEEACEAAIRYCLENLI